MKKLTIMIGLLLININIFATGSPYANIKLKPIATNYEGHVLFQTFSDVNKEGSYSCSSDKFGWLVVSAYGLWDERIAYDTSEIFNQESCEFNNKEKYEAYKNGKINLKNPDTVLKKMLEKYYFNRTVSESNEKFKVLELKPKQSCFMGQCMNKVLPQKSLDGLVSTSLIPCNGAKNLRSSFYYEGVALIKTPFYVGEETVLHSKGDNAKGYSSSFNLPTIKPRNFDDVYIDSIVLVDSFKFREPNNAVKKEVEQVVYEIVELLKKSNVESFESINKKYIHPKYGFYYIKRPGAMDDFYHYEKFNTDNIKNRRRAYTAIDFFMGDKSYKTPKIEWKETAFDCGDEAWLANGLIVNDKGYNISKRIYEFNQNSKEEKVKVAFLAKDVWNVSITAWDIVFELKKIDGRWYIVLINSSETDCSA